MKEDIALYRDLLVSIKTRVRQAQYRAVLSANTEMIRLYWHIGCIIAIRQSKEGWGSGVIPKLAADLKNELPEEKGFSDTNLKRMVQSSREYPGLFAEGAPIVSQLTSVLSMQPREVSGTGAIGAQAVPQIAATLHSVAQLSWGHNVLLMQKLTDLSSRLWYARQSLEQGWSRSKLREHIQNQAFERQGGATDFKSLILKRLNVKPDVLLLLGLSPGIEILRQQLRDLGQLTPITSIEAFGLAQRKEAYNGAWYIDAAAASADFETRFRAVYGRDLTAAAAHAYDTVTMIAEGFALFGRTSTASPSGGCEDTHSRNQFVGVVGALKIDELGVIHSNPSVKVIKDGRSSVDGER